MFCLWNVSFVELSLRAAPIAIRMVIGTSSLVMNVSQGDTAFGRAETLVLTSGLLQAGTHLVQFHEISMAHPQMLAPGERRAEDRAVSDAACC